MSRCETRSGHYQCDKDRGHLGPCETEAAPHRATFTPADLAELGSRERRLRGVREAAAGLLSALDGTDRRVSTETRIAVLRAALKATEDIG